MYPSRRTCVGLLDMATACITPLALDSCDWLLHSVHHPLIQRAQESDLIVLKTICYCCQVKRWVL